MPTATVAFRRCIINSPEYGSDEDHVGSRIFFDLAMDDVGFANVYVDVRQFLDEAAEDQPLLVSPPQGYDGPLNSLVFQGVIEFYYRHAVGAKWSMLGMKGVSMRLEGWMVEQEMLVEFEVYDEGLMSEA
ncbi:MAG: hypothetical protein O7F12_12830 [Nitrospirae bacterium]|nr:hypothetical protein [Nitrospirota bacterium]